MIGRAGILALVLLAVSPAELPGAARGELRIRESSIDTGQVYFEGAYLYARVRRARDGRLVKQWRSARDLSRVLRLPPGYYRVDSWTRSCSGTCDDLDPPSDRCRATFRVRPGRYVTATIHAGVGIACRITNP